MKASKKVLVVVLAMVMVFVSFGSLIKAESSAKWTQTKTPDGWMKVENEGGITLGYSSKSGIQLIEVDGYAFKDLNKNGELDVYEDWRVDSEVRAVDLAGKMTGEEIAPLLTHGGWRYFGTDISGSDLEYIQKGGRAGVTRSAGNEGNARTAAAWTNALQAICEAEGAYGIPATISMDPMHISMTVDQLSLGATMDPDLAHEIAVETAKQYRAVGVTMLLGPQVDIATSPIWDRASGAYSEDPALSRDLAAAFIDGLQSTYDADGNDLGWGEDSVVAIVKHFAGAGASEGGRNDHFDPGKYTVYPGECFDAHLIAFFDGAFNLPGKTKSSAGLMPNYAIAYSEDGSLGNLDAGAYSEYKMNLLRNNGYDGFIVTDWGVDQNMAFGVNVEKMNTAERFCELLRLGNDQVGGSSDIDGALAGYRLLAKEIGEDAALEQIRNAARRFFVTQMNTGLFDNPYVTAEKAVATVWTAESIAYGEDTQVKSIVMLKNTDNTIHAFNETAEKATAYIPYIYKVGGNPFFGFTYSCGPAFDIEAASKYYNVVTDSVGEPSGTDENGKAKYMPEDIIRASAEEIAACDYALVRMTAPKTDSSYDAENDLWLPASIQYEEYTADSNTVRDESIAGDIVKSEIVTVYGVTVQEVKQNRSYYGNTAALPASYADYRNLKYVDSVVSDDCKVIVVMNSKAAMVWSEVEPMADAILTHFIEAGFGGGIAITDATLLRVVTGVDEPSGLLPIQQPISMEAVEAQLEDVPRDVECYVDQNGNTYDFAFGLNWSGVINDERVAKYFVAPLTKTATPLIR